MNLPDLLSLLPGLPLQHLGELHRYETALVLLIAFGPFLVIAMLARRERRRAAPEQHGGGGEDGLRGPGG